MAYQELKLPERTPTEVRSLIQDRIRPFLVDVHTMLRLPVDESALPGGCNLSAALVLLSVVAGVSNQLYRCSSLDPREQSGESFKRVLSEFFPWAEEPNTEGAIIERHAAEILYIAYRNPLAHSAGVYDDSHLGSLKVAKGPLSEDQIEAIERAEVRPGEWTRPTLETDSRDRATRTKTVLTVKCFYWGVRKMIGEVVARQWVDQTKVGRSAPTITASITATATSVFTNVTSASTEPTEK